MFVQFHSSFLTLLCSRGRRGPHAPSMAKPAARARWEFWFLILTLSPFKTIKIPAFSLAGGALSLLFRAECDMGLLLLLSAQLPQSSCEASAPLWTCPYLILQDLSTQTSHREVRKDIRLPVHSVVPANLHFPEGGNVHGRSSLRTVVTWEYLSC